ncbi:GGDEF domain-containing protein [Planctomycetota bacterium]
MVLCHVAAFVDDVVKHIGFAARYGVEKYAVIVAGKTAQEIREIAQKIRRIIENHSVKLKDQVLRVTASLDAACVQFPSPQSTPEQIIRQADRNLYCAKHQGRNRVEM